ncbi:putative MATE family efflux protein [Herbinix hemicellulosilytica]|uniref:Probable multidrug resistance protein NorM n=2 Tax=Herbinix hemicellulosilytica TaxID=1564487 RepID=A0A0H5SZG5_HERHM|nr:putative MATE family efflux protein [Herbinix hemicellulosilytica]CRZ35783.1 putative membrane protein [Herbinix hemicellulosilytica]
MVSYKKDKEISFGPMFRKIILFALPIMAMNILQLLFNAADLVVVGRFASKEAMAAVGATGAIINLIVNLFMGLSVGTSVIVAQDYGAQDAKAIEKSVHTSITVSVIAGITVMILGLLLCNPMLIMIGTPADIIDLSAVYMRIYFLGVPASMIYNFGAAILRAIGDSRRPMYYLVISGITNALLNMYFVIVLNMSVNGVAWATIISQYLSMILILWCLIRNEERTIRLNLRKLHIDREKLAKVIKIGLPAGLQSLLFSISNVLIQSAINSFGTAMVAASSAAGNIEGFVATPMNAYYNAAITYTGQSMGAKKYDRIDEIAKICTILTFATWIIVGGLTMIFSRPLLSIFNSDPEVIRLGAIRINVLMVAYFTCGIMNVFPGLTRGMGYSVLPMLCTLIGACLFRIVWLVTFFKWFRNVYMLFACYPVTWALAGIGQVVSFFYARKKIRQEA